MPPRDTSFPRAGFWAAGTITLAAVIAYANSFSGSFIFDDINSIPLNFSIRHLWTWWDVFSSSAANGNTVGDRPLLNFSFALNYALNGRQVWGYHLGNLLIHLGAALALFGLVRRTLSQPLLAEKFGRDALPLAWAVALLWAVHPLQTEAVAYMVQRAESLAALLYLLTLYCFCRATQSAAPNRWLALSVLCCLVGTGVKEIIVSAPLVVLLYDRAFVSGGFGAAWRQRKTYYLALFGTWIVLAAFIAPGGTRWGSVGLVKDSAGYSYTLLQFSALADYLALSLWPHPLNFYYTPAMLKDPGRIAISAAFVLPLVAISAASLRGRVTPQRRWPMAGFLGCAFFLVLAPTTLVPLKGVMAEHRMYLPLAAVLTGVVLALHRWAGIRGVAILAAIATPLFVALTWQRNADYRHSLVLWAEIIAETPDAAKTRNSYGVALSDAGRYREALAQLQEAIRLKPDDPLFHCDLGVLYDRLGRRDDALAEYGQALAIDPNHSEIYCDRAVALEQMGRLDEAIADYRKALALWPNYVRAHANLGVAYVEKGDLPDAVAEYQAALAIDGDDLEAHSNLGEAYGEQGRFQDALAEYRQVLRLDPGNAEAHYNRGVAFTRLGDIDSARTEYQEALCLNPQYGRAAANLRALH